VPILLLLLLLLPILCARVGAQGSKNESAAIRGDGQHAATAPAGTGTSMHMSAMSAMPAMSLHFFCDKVAATHPMVIIWSGWEVRTWGGYCISLVVLGLWALAHEWLAGIRGAVLHRMAVDSPQESSHSCLRRGARRLVADGSLEAGLTTSPAVPVQTGVVVSTTSSPLSTAEGEHWPVQPASAVAPDTCVVRIRGMTCEGCAGRIRTVLRAQHGVLSADVRYDHGRAAISYNAALVTAQDLVERIGDLGYDTAEDVTAVKTCYAACSSAAGAVTAHTGDAPTAEPLPTGLAAVEQQLVSRIASLRGGGKTAAKVALVAIQTTSTYLLMLATMTFEVGVIAAVVAGRSAGSEWLGGRGLGKGMSTRTLDCCTS
jgi:copper chaperone